MNVGATLFADGRFAFTSATRITTLVKANANPPYGEPEKLQRGFFGKSRGFCTSLMVLALTGTLVA